MQLVCGARPRSPTSRRFGLVAQRYDSAVADNKRVDKVRYSLDLGIEEDKPSCSWLGTDQRIDHAPVASKPLRIVGVGGDERPV